MLKIDYVKAKKIIAGNCELVPKVDHQNELMLEFDGFWFSFSETPNIVGNFFFGKNELTENMEGYINLWINKLIAESDINLLINKVKTISNKLKLLHKLNLLYVNIFTDIKEIQLKFIDFTQINDPDVRFLSYIISKNAQVHHTKIENKNLVIRAANDQDLDNVTNCLVQAYINGTLPEMYKKIGLDRFKQNIKNYYYNFLKSEKNFTVVGELDGEFTGHASFSLDEMDYFGGFKQAKLIDSFVLEKFNGLNIGTALVNFGEQECYNRGITKIVGTVDYDIEVPSKALKILNRLTNNNWKLESFIFLC